MNIKLEPAKVFTLHLEGKAYPEMRQTGEWEGMIKLEGRAGTVILMDSRGPFHRAITNQFEYATTGWVLVSASPDILAALPTQGGQGRAPSTASKDAA